MYMNKWEPPNSFRLEIEVGVAWFFMSEVSEGSWTGKKSTKTPKEGSKSKKRDFKISVEFQSKTEGTFHKQNHWSKTASEISSVSSISDSARIDNQSKLTKKVTPKRSN